MIQCLNSFSDLAQPCRRAEFSTLYIANVTDRPVCHRWRWGIPRVKVCLQTKGVGCIEHRQRKSTETRKARSATARLIGCNWTWRGPFSKSTHRRVSCFPTLDCTHLPCVVRLLYRPQAEYLAVFFSRSSLSRGVSSSTPFVSRRCRSFYIVSLSFAFLQSLAVR